MVAVREEGMGREDNLFHGYVHPLTFKIKNKGCSLDTKLLRYGIFIPKISSILVFTAGYPPEENLGDSLMMF